MTVACGTFDLQAHRGGRGLAPENTMAAFKRAIAIGVTTIETDLAVTRDGVVVISHDPTLHPDLVRDSDGRWLPAKGPAIHSLTYAELNRYELGRIRPGSSYANQFPLQEAVDGQRFPTLADVLALAPARAHRLRFNVETKITPASAFETPDPATFARLVVEAITKADLAERVSVQSFDWRTLVEVKKIAPDIATVCLTIESANFDTVQRASGAPSVWHAGFDLRDYGGSLPRMVKAAGCTSWSMFWRNLTAESADEARALGLKLMPWTVNERVDMARLIDLGVDGIITDYPDRLREVMVTKGVPLP